ncbi:MAG: dTDP-4-dehydrorhamnose 3,5-epimerase [Oligosphaeraceae bacterium]
MLVKETALPGLLLLEPPVFQDARGYFLETWQEEHYRQAGISCHFVQDNESKSSFGVVRGLHWQAPPYTQAKLVRVIQGTVLDVSVDLRKNSPTFGQHVAVELSGENKRQLFIPRGFAHGFAVLSPEAIFAYKCDNPYRPEAERGLKFDDPALAIDWKLPPQDWILSEKDKHHPTLKEIQPVEI